MMKAIAWQTDSARQCRWYGAQDWEGLLPAEIERVKRKLRFM